MRSNNVRRVSAVAGLALVPALAFGAVAQAAPAPSEPTSTPIGQEQSDLVVVAKGTISKLGYIKTPEGTFVGFKLGKDSPWWFAGKDTLVLKDGQVVPANALEEGDFVFAEGTPDNGRVDATRVTVD